jgi:serpin B
MGGGLIAALLCAAVLMSVWGAGCKPKGAGAAVSDVPRAIAPDVPAADLAAVVAGNNRFALDLYQAVRGEENTLYSPYSISLALAMTYAGARGETAQQMAETLHYTLPPAQLHAAFNALDQALRAEDETEGAFRLHLINAIWGQEGYTFLAPFLDTLAEHYGAGMRLLDFGASEAARETINAWAREETEDRIAELLPGGAIDASTTLVLANAIYFKAAWLAPFEPGATADAPFTRLDGSQVTVKMMRHPVPLGYAQGDGYQAVELLYSGERASMVIVLPDEGRFEAVAATLDAARLEAMVGDMDRATLDLYLPRFSYGAGFQLRDTLVAMGMRAPFEDADFSGMDGTRSLSIDDVYHKAFIAVDEAGTEAAAATAVVMTRGMPPALRIDRPFVYLIRDTATGSILFVGQVLDPAG